MRPDDRRVGRGWAETQGSKAGHTEQVAGCWARGTSRRSTFGCLQDADLQPLKSLASELLAHSGEV